MPKNITEITNDNKYHYNYVITNLNNHMRYVGVRSCSCWPTEDIKYWGSCNNLKESILKEGKEWFKKEILAIWDTRELAVEHEIRLHNHFEVGANPMFYNKSKQTNTGFDTTGIIVTEETRKKLSLSGKDRKHTEDTKRRMRKPKSDKSNMRKPKSEEHKKKIGLSNRGKTHTEESKNKMSLSSLGENNGMWGKGYLLSGKIHTEETKEKISLAISGENNGMYGKKHSKESINKMKQPRKKIQCPHCNKIGSVSNMKRWHFDNCKFI